MLIVLKTIVECKRKDIALSLSDYYTGHLDKGQRDLVKTHLGACQECRESLRMMATVSAEIEPEELEREPIHYSPELLGRYHLNPGSLGDDLVDRISQHLEHCSLCSADLIFLQESHQDIGQYLAQKSQQSQPTGLLIRLRQLFGKIRAGFKRATS